MVVTCMHSVYLTIVTSTPNMYRCTLSTSHSLVLLNLQNILKWDHHHQCWQKKRSPVSRKFNTFSTQTKMNLSFFSSAYVCVCVFLFISFEPCTLLVNRGNVACFIIIIAVIIKHKQTRTPGVSIQIFFSSLYNSLYLISKSVQAKYYAISVLRCGVTYSFAMPCIIPLQFGFYSK